ncbi:MAG: helix-turn-helix transcriptional regulator [Dehalococcoidia bacterium]
MADPSSPSVAEPKPRLHGEMLSTSLLAFLKNWNAYGYQLAQQLAASGMPECDNGTIYRTLRQLEKSGLVSSFWDTSESGPARRMYSLTAAGDLFLTGWINALQNYQNVLQQAMSGWATFMSPASGTAARPQTPDSEEK